MFPMLQFSAWRSPSNGIIYRVNGCQDLIPCWGASSFPGRRPFDWQRGSQDRFVLMQWMLSYFFNDRVRDDIALSMADKFMGGLPYAGWTVTTVDLFRAIVRELPFTVDG